MKVLNSAEIKKVIYAQLEPKEDMYRAIVKLVEENDVNFGFLVALGTVERLRIGHAKPDKTFTEIIVDKPLEISTAFGRIWRDEKPQVHVHITAGDKEGRAYAGHLLEGSPVAILAEIMILKAL
ncbi:MAG: DNA-binding protein [Nitrososphaerales archaeon]